MKTIDLRYFQEFDQTNITGAADLLDEIGSNAAIRELNWVEQFPYRPITKFTIARSLDAIFIKYCVSGNILKAVHEKDNEAVFEDSCVEFFCQIPDSEYYFNFEFNCIGTCSAAKRKARKNDVIRFSLEELKTIERYPSIGHRAFQTLEGIFDWELTVKIPFKLLDLDRNQLPDSLNANFYKCAVAGEYTHYVTWNPVLTPEPDFHQPHSFGLMNIK